MVLLLNKLMLSKNIRKRNLLSFKGMKTSTRITGNFQKTQELIEEYSLFLMTYLLIQNEERYWPFQLLLLFFFSCFRPSGRKLANLRCNSVQNILSINISPEDDLVHK